jgi:hypothetical protein
MNTERSPAARDEPPAIWLSAIVAWSSFLGAAVVTMLLLVLAPRLSSDGYGYGWGEIGRWFLLSWLACLVPVICALSLARMPRGPS